MRRAIYTANFGGRDEMHDPRSPQPGTDYICFTDDPELRSDVWDMRVMSKGHDDPCRDAKRYKVLAHEVLEGYDASVWIDCSFRLEGERDVWKVLEDVELGFFPHPSRRCVYEEAKRIQRCRQDHPKRVDRVVREYRELGFPENYGLWKGGIVFRQHIPTVKQFELAWWELICAGSRRDQLSLPVTIWMTGIKPVTLNPRVINLRQMGHRRRRKGVTNDQRGS